MSVDRATLLKEEYFHLQEMIETFDARALQIKGWSVTVSLAGMAAALIADVPPALKALAFVVAATAALAFWMIEYSWKRFQWSFYPRVREIEAAFASEAPLPAPLQINRSFKEAIDTVEWRDALKPFYPFIMFPHAGIAAMGFYLAAHFWAPVAAGARVPGSHAPAPIGAGPGAYASSSNVTATSALAERRTVSPSTDATSPPEI